jgi:hypothetical protein
MAGAFRRHRRRPHQRSHSAGDGRLFHGAWPIRSERRCDICSTRYARATLLAHNFRQSLTDGGVLGNHDINDTTTLEAFRKDYDQPDYYTFERSNSHFFMLNSITLISNLTNLQSAHDAQWAWFEHELEKTSKKMSHNPNSGPTFVVMHHPPFLVTEDEPEQYFNWPVAPRQRFLALVRDTANSTPFG